jgi:predicted nucleic acid-binding protein
MPVKVVDASAIAALLFGEPEAADVADRRRGRDLAAPALLPCEIASVHLKKLKRHPEQEEALLTGHRLLARMSVAQHDVELAETVELARQAGLSAYDASYLWLSRHLRAELVTLDAKLARASAAA